MLQLRTSTYTGQAEVTAHKYSNGRLALVLENPSTGQMMFKATVNVPEYKDPRLDDNSHVLIKNWSENEGVLPSLLEARIVGAPVAHIATGQVNAALCPVLIAER
jgi:hypothetical protein